MKVKIAMMFALCLTQVPEVWSQKNPEKWIIKHVVLETDPNPRFIRLIAESIISWGGYTTDKDVTCIKQELMKTGVFNKIDSRLHKLKESEGYDLILTTEFESSDLSYKLTRIDVFGVDGVDKDRFKELASSHLNGQPLSLKTADYLIFVEKVFDL